MRIPLAALAPLIAPLATAGCLGPAFIEPLDIDIDVPEVAAPAAHLEDVRHAPDYDIMAMTARVRVEGEVRLQGNVSAPRVELFLAEGRCPTTGPFGAPDAYADRADVAFETPRETTVRAFEAELSARVPPGAPYAVYAHATPHGLGPGFAECEEFVAAPR